MMPSRLRLVITNLDDIEQVIARITTLLTSPSAHSDGFTATLTMLLRMSEEKQLNLEDAVIPVTMALSFANDGPANRLLPLLVEYQRTKNTHSDHPKHYRFVLDDVTLDVSRASISGSLIDAVELFKSTPGLRFRTIDLPLFRPHYDFTVIYEKQRIPWRWAVAATGLPNHRTLFSPDAIQASGVQLGGSHRVECSRLSRYMFSAFFSSIMYSSEVHELVIKQSIFGASPQPTLLKLKWCWLMYALFNEEACHAVTSLSIYDDDI